MSFGKFEVCLNRVCYLEAPCINLGLEDTDHEFDDYIGVELLTD